MTARASLRVLASKIKDTKKKTEKARVKKIKKREENKKKNVPTWSLAPPPSGQNGKKRLKIGQVRSWFYEGVTQRTRGVITVPPENKFWTGADYGIAKHMIEAYEEEYELIRDAIFLLCDSWDDMVKDSKGRLYGLPTMKFLWSNHSSLFAAVQRGETYISISKLWSGKGKGGVVRKGVGVGEWVDPGDDDAGGF